MLVMASRMWWRYAGSSGVIDHHGITVYCIGKVRAHGVLGDKIHVSPESTPEFILDSNKLEETFFAGEPDQYVDITCCAGISPGIGAEDRNPVGTVPGEYTNDCLTGLLR